MAALASAISMYEQSTRIDSQLRDKHWTLCWNAVQRAIRLRREHVDYEVPASIYGPYPVYVRKDMVLFLLGECRQQGLSVQLLSSSGATIRISGWAERARSKLKQDQDFARDFRLVHTNDSGDNYNNGDGGGEVMRVPRPPQKRQQLGALSAHLKHVAARGKKN